MPLPCRAHFVSPGAAHMRACLSPGWRPFLGKSPYRDWGRDSRSQETEAGLEAGRKMAQAVQPTDPLLFGYAGC